MEPRSVFLRAGAAEPAVGRNATLRRLPRRPLRRAPRAVGRQRAVRAGPAGHGLRQHRYRTRRHGRPDDRRGAKRLHLQRGVRRAGQPGAGRASRLGHGRGRRGRFLRPVPDDPGGIEPDRRHGLVRHPADLLRGRAADHAAGQRIDPGDSRRRRPAAARPAARRCARRAGRRATCCSTSAISSAASRWCSSACTSPPTCSTRASARTSA